MLTKEVNTPLIQSTESALNKIEGIFMNKLLEATNSSLFLPAPKSTKECSHLQAGE